MCGIAGFCGGFDPGLLAAMGARLVHRGPDDRGEYAAPRHGIGLAHRRLSIIDPTPAGRQPMASPDGSLRITYNGEIYNYRELTAELSRHGHRFRSACDTEVLLHLYRRYGLDMFGRLNGIYAFALWDADRRRLLLARDGLGVKPLYYCETPAGVLFASEIKALLASPAVPRELDLEALDDHLAFLWTAAPRTILKAVRKLEPGGAMLLRDGRVVRRWRHYELPGGQARRPAPVGDLARELRRRLQRAVARQLVSDVPLGAFLSGGLDSSAVVALMRRAQPGRRPVCYTIGFRGGGGPDGAAADLPYARRVARHLDVELREIMIGPEVVGDLERTLWRLDEPLADPAAINTLLIARYARQEGIRVLLSGTGGDDVFAGYRRHQAVRLRRLAPPLPAAARAALAGWANAAPGRGVFMRRLRRALAYADLRGDAWLASLFAWSPRHLRRGLLAPAVRERLGERDALAALARSLRDIPGEPDALNRTLYLDLRHFLADHNLNYTDKMGMAAGVEIRVPLIDPEVIRFAAGIPPRLKLRRGQGKYLLRRAMAPLLPREVVHRAKTGFGAPLRRWMRRELRPMTDDVLSEEALRRRGLFDPAAVRALIRRDRAGEVDGAYPVFSVLCLELWCRAFLDRQSAP